MIWRVSEEAQMAHLVPEVFFPESRVLIIITGGTICMKRSENGLVPVSARYIVEKA